MSGSVLHLTFFLRYLSGGEMLIEVQAVVIPSQFEQAGWAENYHTVIPLEWSRLKSELAAANVLSDAELLRIDKELPITRIALARTTSPLSALTQATSKAINADR